MLRRVIGLLIVAGIAWGGLAAVYLLDIEPKLGLDLQGGTSVVLTAPDDTDPDVMEYAVEIMRSRIEDVGGVQEPEISISGGTTVLVQLPGVQNEQQALDAIGRTGRLSFRPVLESTPGLQGPLVTTTTTEPPAGEEDAVEESASTTATTVATTTTTAILADTPEGVDPISGLTVSDDPDTVAYLPNFTLFGMEVLTVGPAAMTGSDVSQALPGFNSVSAQWVVNLSLTSEGGDLFAELTGEAAAYPIGDPRRQIAIVLDGQIIASPQVAEDVAAGVGITGGDAIITLGADPAAEDQAQNLAVILRYGSLPVAFERSQVEKVSATLGSDSLRIGLISGIAGLVLVAVVLLLYYRSLGLVAVLGIAVFGSLLIAIYALLGHYQGVTLTLAGVTGIIVAVGITADSYIVYFERIKDELRAGRTVPSAAAQGFRTAFRTILTADTVSILGATLLWLLTVGAVRGFALSLGIATVLDIFVARAFTRRAAWVLAHSPLGRKGWFSMPAAAGESR
ncbi:MAG: protein translocase subunit SecD [Acidimicrobiia bacterium]|nr:protein translocase subunit SecD [bacterium]MXX02073.1 protein translocase subunit SecD [Acidimicrobiia bacterium]MDE0675275.1 protein translocase subunit SecD [bacterium]MXX46318.1 protein translocase subunit SecD [Acidimicrobiia bacterium]MXY74099.1 protein translocase subunit SecD [Acidimicrobiia bacterium]